jgi:hypothetical protein
VTTPPPQYDPSARDVAAFIVMAAGALMVLLCSFAFDPLLGFAVLGVLCMAAGAIAGTHRGR